MTPRRLALKQVYQAHHPVAAATRTANEGRWSRPASRSTDGRHCRQVRVVRNPPVASLSRRQKTAGDARSFI